MSYGIVRVQKMGAGSVKGIEIHDRREKEGISHTNKDIDWERTRLNYNLHPDQNSNFQRAIKERISKLNLKRAVRKDAVVMGQVLVTSEHKFFEEMTRERQEQFFRDSYNFLADRYGKENVISATVHLDERTPHMHFNFVPVTPDGRLAAKSVLTRQSLIEQQTAFQERVGKQYGLERGLEGGKKRHLDVLEYKALTATERAQEALRSVSKAQERAQAIKDQIGPLRVEYEAKKAYVRECDKESQISHSVPDYAKVKKSLFGKEKITVPREKWEQKHISANEKGYLDRATRDFDKALKDFRHTTSAENMAKMEKTIENLEKQLHKSEFKTTSLEKQLQVADRDIDMVMNRLSRVLNKFPEKTADRFVAEWKAEIEIEKSIELDLSIEHER